MAENDYISHYEADTFEFIQRSGHTGLPFSVVDNDLLEDGSVGPTQEPFYESDLHRFELMDSFEREMTFEEIMAGRMWELFDDL